MLYLFGKDGHIMNVYHYKTASGKDLIMEYIDSLSKTDFTFVKGFEKDIFKTLKKAIKEVISSGSGHKC
jgi:hypothetical protein